MGDSLFTFTGEKDYEPFAILKVTVPIEAYTHEERKAIYESVKEQVGTYYLPILVPENVKLEIISE